MRTFGLIGFPLGHSFSQRYFNEKFQREGIEACEYLNFPMEQIEGLTSLRQQYPSLCGFNVTIPHKQAILPYLAHLSPEAATIGAVNCVRVTPAGLIGYNTDALGFRSALLHLLHGVHPAKALVLGSGGASKAVHFVLQQLEIASVGVSRQAHSGGYTYESLTPEIVADYPLIVNATPLGTFPKVEGFPPIPYEGIGSHHFLFDLVYNPPLTEFLRRGAAHGAAVLNGYEMLVGQAEAGWKIWNEPL